MYSSDLDRAIETAKIAIPGCDYETDSLLREIDLGSISNQPTNVISAEERKYAVEYGYERFGGESRDAFRKRIVGFKDKLALLDCENVAVFCHGGWVKGFLNEIVGQTQNVCCNNCTVAVFEYQNSKWQLHSWINLL